MLTQEEINKIRQDAGVAPLGQITRPSLSSRLGISVSPRIAKLRAEADIAEKEAERSGSFGGMAKTFGKDFISQAGEISGIAPTGRRIAAGVAPYVVPKEELPDVVETLVGGVEGKKKMGATGELAQKIGLPESVAEGIDVAVDLPLISLGLSKNISKFLGEQAGKSAPELAKILNRPLTEFLPEGLKKVGQVDVGKPSREIAEKVEKFLGKKIEASRLAKIEKINKQTNDIVGRIIQGKPEDITQAKRALGNIDTEGVKTFKELKETMENKTASLASKLDNYLDEQDLRLGNLKPSQLAVETKVGERIIRQDFVSDALKQLNELYKTIKDAPAQARILDLRKKLTTDGLTRKEINVLAREYGREFSNKAFSKIGEPLTSVNAQAFENTRKGIKKVVRQNVEGDVPKMLDEQMSDLIETERLVGKMEEKANNLYQKVKKRGILEKGARKLADIVNLATFNTIHGFISRMLPSNVGLKTMNSLDIQQELGKNLIKLEKLLKTTDDKVLIEGLIDFIKNPKIGLGIEDVSKKGSGAIRTTNDDLLQEARKYKSAEEFVKAQGTPVYRGDSTPIKLSEMDTAKVFNPAEKEALGAFNNTPGLYFTDSVSNAKSYGKNLTEVSVSPIAKVINVNDAPKILKRADVEKIIRSNPRIKDWATNWSENFNDAIKQITDSVMAEKDGNEFLKAIWSDGGFSEKDFIVAMKNAGIDGLKVPKEGVNHFVIYNKDALQTKSQLTDIWNKANKK